MGMARHLLLTYTDDITNAADVRDIAMGHLLAMDKGEKGRSYILGNTENISMKELLKLCLKVNGRKIPIIKLWRIEMQGLALAMQLAAIWITRKAPLLTYEAVVANQMGLAADCSRAVNELGYSCRPLEESIKDALAWFKSKN